MYDKGRNFVIYHNVRSAVGYKKKAENLRGYPLLPKCTKYARGDSPFSVTSTLLGYCKISHNIYEKQVFKAEKLVGFSVDLFGF